MKRVCHLTTVHRPDDIRIFRKMCASLAHLGYDTHLVATQDADSTVDGVQIHALPKPKNRIERILKSGDVCLSKALEVQADLYHFHDPELLPVGLKLKAAGKTVVYDAHENHGASLRERAYLHPLLRPLMAGHVERLEHRADKALDAVVTATPAIATQFKNPRTTVVQNYPLLAEFSHVVGQPQADRPRRVSYIGGISELRSAAEMVEAASLVGDLELCLAGPFTPASLENQLKSVPGWDRVVYLGWLDRPAVAKLLGDTRVGLVLFKPAKNHVEAQPNKIFEYMAAGIPLIGSNFPLWKEIIEKERVGFTVDPTSPKEIAQAVQKILDDPAESDAMGQRGRHAVETKFSWEAEFKKLSALYFDLIGPPA